ncbi:pyrroline-5-carboxylate reductase [Oribacterium sp. WCC10]|uniref:pyrroline-5-carboxylate reductase n=1 Tax=Oribacterium sp. WCC10 TaxID=1855343 RepID=UPI0008EB5EAE|nr:pyrroline-5-carboxylate reductase [Oribacterium sp. WCC10]SFG33760.1 pyrroline-5-carboxylate reductase [Oribacterium sp. WCC10]
MKTIDELKIGFIGFGNMAGATAKGLINSGLKADNMYAAAGHFDKLKEKCEEMGGINPCKSAEEVAQLSDLVFIAIKPNKIKEVISPVKTILSGEKHKTLISVAWGYNFDRYFEEGILKNDTHIICTCPNTPVSINKGIFVVENKHSLNYEEYEMIEELLGRISLVIPVETRLMDVSGTVCGCGPAFADLFIEALGDAAVMYGIPRKTAYRMVSRMLEGTAAMQLSSGKHPGEMKDDVCSPGGVTIKGVAALEEKGFRAALIDAVKAIQG